MFNDFEDNLDNSGWKLAKDWQLDDLVANPSEHDRQDQFATDVHAFLNSGTPGFGLENKPEASTDAFPGSPVATAFGHSGQEPSPFDTGLAHGLQSFMKAGQTAGGGFGATPIRIGSDGSSRTQFGSEAENQATSGNNPTSGQAGNQDPPVQTGAGGKIGSKVMAPVEYPIKNMTDSTDTSGNQTQTDTDAQRALWEKMKGIDQESKDYLGAQERQEPQRNAWEKLKGIDQESVDYQRQADERRRWEEEKGIDSETRRKYGTLWPGDGIIRSPMGVRPNPHGDRDGNGNIIMKEHKGIDIRNPSGGSVRASESGEVIYVGPYGDGGNTVMVRTRSGLISVYHHTRSAVKAGDWVVAGDSVGNTDVSGRVTGPHIHYGVYDPSIKKYIDPQTRLPKR